MTLEMVHCFPGILNIVGAAGGGTIYSRILRNGAVIIDDAGYSGQQVDCLDTADSYPFQVKAYSYGPDSAKVSRTPMRFMGMG